MKLSLRQKANSKTRVCQNPSVSLLKNFISWSGHAAFSTNDNERTARPWAKEDDDVVHVDDLEKSARKSSSRSESSLKLKERIKNSH